MFVVVMSDIMKYNLILSRVVNIMSLLRYICRVWFASEGSDKWNGADEVPAVVYDRTSNKDGL